MALCAIPELSDLACHVGAFTDFNATQIVGGSGAGGSSAAGVTAANARVGTLSDESDAWWVKFGIKKQFFSAGVTSFAIDFGIYSDQYGFNEAVNGVTGSEVERIGFSVDQYFGDSLIIYGKWEQLELDVDGTARAAVYSGADDLSTLVLGGVYFF
jgi:hypothetical protein